MSDTEPPTNRAILAVYLFYEERFLIALTPKWLLKNWCSSWSIHLEYLSFSSFHLKHHRKICWRIIKVMHSRNWRLFVKVGNSIRDDQHCIDIVWPALYTKYSIHSVAGPFTPTITPTITPTTTPTPFRKVQKNVGWQFDKEACNVVMSYQFLVHVSCNFLGWCFFLNTVEPSFCITVGVSVFLFEQW